METITIRDTGTHLSSSRGHYISRDVIQFAQEFGFIIGPFEEWAVHCYDGAWSSDDYPQEALIELCDEAVAWFNSGQGECGDCLGHGVNPQSGEYYTTKGDDNSPKWCKTCTGTGRGDRIQFQNFPPIIGVDNASWGFEDGDFGLWLHDDDGNVIDAA